MSRGPRPSSYGDREAVGDDRETGPAVEQPGEREDRAAAVEVDGVGRTEQPECGRGDPLLLGGGRAGLHVELRLIEARVRGDDAAVDPPQPAGGADRVEVPPDGRR
jgi:hypothetical protein